jgi:hypothetical protein
LPDIAVARGGDGDPFGRNFQRIVDYIADNLTQRGVGDDGDVLAQPVVNSMGTGLRARQSSTISHRNPRAVVTEGFRRALHPPPSGCPTGWLCSV